MSLLSVASSGAGQMRGITIWGAASAAGAAAGPLIGGLLVDLTGWQASFWIDAAIAAAAVASIDNAVTVNHEKAGVSPSDALAAGLSRRRSSSRSCSAAGIALALLMARHHQRRAKAVDLAAAAAASSHTIPTRPVTT
jgi:MFS family permease